jgi:methionine-rich copper-binding protein CopC/putative copper export protein
MTVMHKGSRIVLGLFCFSLVMSCRTELVFAHATPIQYVPAASSLLSQAPSEVEIRFSERVEPRVSSIVVLGPDGSRVDLSNSAVDATDQKTFSVGLKNGGAGPYTVSWEVISADDGHFAKGAYVFSVGGEGRSASTEAGGFQTVHSSGVPEALTLAVELIGDAFILGALIVLVFIWRPLRRHFPEMKSDEDGFVRRFQVLLVLGCVLALAGGVAYLFYKTHELTSLQEKSFTEAWSAFIGTTSALSTIYRMLSVLFIWIASATMHRKLVLAEKSPKIEHALFAALVGIDFARARISHAAASTFAPGFGVVMNFVHLLFKDAWIGGTFAVVVLLSPLIRKSRNLRVAAYVLTALSRTTSIALGIAGVAGVYVVWLHLKSFSYLLTSDWGKRFVVLAIFAAFLLVLRLFDQLYVEPEIIEAITENDEMQLPRVFSWLSLSLPAEAAMGIAVLAVTSLLIITTPPLVPHYGFGRSAVSQGIALSLTEQPYERDRFLVAATDPTRKAAADLKRMVVTLTNQAGGIGPIVAPVEERFAGGYVFARDLLAPAGAWTINITAQRADAYDATASFHVNYPQEITASDAHALDRTLGLFEVIHIIVALALLMASAILYSKSSKSQQLVLSASDEAPAGTALTFARRGAWIPPVALIAIVLYLTGGFPVVFPGVLRSRFERACEEANIMDVWHESVPERDGKATADLALPGCTVGIGLGQYHFADAREFAYFERPARARAQLATEPAALDPNIPVLLTFKLRDYQGNPIEDLVLDHNRIAHVIIASKDFSIFSHIHLEDFGPVTPEMRQTATFPVHYTFAKPGEYLVSVDFMERGYLFSDQFYLKVGLPATMSGSTSGPGSDPSARQENVEGYDVTLKTSPARLRAGVTATLDYHVNKDGKPFTEMNPYLAVPMHISIIREDLMGFLHIHGLLPVSLGGKLLGESIHSSHLLLPDKFGPDIEATNFTFPSAGNYHIFGEFSAGGKIVVTQFTVNVE